MSVIPTLGAGDLNKQIEILAPIEVNNGKGGLSTSWEVIATPWAEVLGQNGREAVIGQALQGISVYRIRIRWRSGITAKHQVRLGGVGGEDLNITAPPADPNGRREQLMILASTESAQATS